MRWLMVLLALAVAVASCGGASQVVEAGGLDWSHDGGEGPDTVVALGGGFVGSRNGELLWSEEGLEWAEVDSSLDDATVLAGGSNGAIAQTVADDGAVSVATSSDGAEWVVSDPLSEDRPEEYWVKAAAVGDLGYFVAFVVPAGLVADEPQNLLFTSTDGVAWEQVDSPAELLVLSGLAVSPAGFMIIGDPMVDGNPGMMSWFSADALSWSMQAISADYLGDADLVPFAWEGGFVAASSSGMWRNPDGTAWEEMAGAPEVDRIVSTSSLGLLAATVDDSMEYVFHLTMDGSAWTTFESDATGVAEVSDAAISTSQVLLVGPSGAAVGVPSG